MINKKKANIRIIFGIIIAVAIITGIIFLIYFLTSSDSSQSSGQVVVSALDQIEQTIKDSLE